MIRAGVFIGVDKTGGLQRLHDAAAGAERMYRWALGQGMAERTHAKLVTDAEGRRVSPDAIYDAIKEILDGPGVDQLIVVRVRDLSCKELLEVGIERPLDDVVDWVLIPAQFADGRIATNGALDHSDLTVVRNPLAALDEDRSCVLALVSSSDQSAAFPGV